MTVDAFEGADYIDDENSPFEEADPIAELRSQSGQIEETGTYRRMPDPLTGKMKRFSRASNFSYSDETVLNMWKMAMAVMGVAKNRSLYALANSEPVPEQAMEFRNKGWWMPWYDIAVQGMDWADAHNGARLGTAVHRWSEQVELGTLELKSVPREWRKHVTALLRIRAANHLVIVPHLRERLIVNRGLHNGLCGKFDAICLDKYGRLVLDDTKTGKNVPDFGLGEIAIQLSIYVNAEYLHEPDNAHNEYGYIPMPECRTDMATVTWIPIDRPEDAEIIPVDIADGWEAAKHTAALKEHQNKSRRKMGNGLRLPISSLYSDPEMEDHDAKRYLIENATSIEELTSIVTDLFSSGFLTSGLEAMAIMKNRQIKAES